MVGKFLSHGLFIDLVDQEMQNRWSIIGDFSVSALFEGFFLFVFSFEKEKLRVLVSGPQSLAGQLLALKPWHLGIRPTSDAFKAVKI